MGFTQHIGKVAGFLCLFFLCPCVGAKCPPQALAPLPFVLEYALWRGWHQAVILTPDVDTVCDWATIRLMKCLSVNGIASSTKMAEDPRVRTRLGVVLLSIQTAGYNASGPLTKLVTELHLLRMDTAYYDWLIVTGSGKDFTSINMILNATSIRFDQNLVVAYPYSKNHAKATLSGLCDKNFSYKIDRKILKSKEICDEELNKDGANNHRAKTGFERTYYKSSDRFKNLSKNNTYRHKGVYLPLYNTGFINYNFSRHFHMTNISKFSLALQFREWQKVHTFDQKTINSQIHLVQYFKAKRNSTLYAQFLGVWSRESSMSEVNIPYPVEARTFLGEELIFGRCNSSDETALDDDGPASPASLDDVLHFFAVRLNATPVTRYYSKLGLRTYEGTWSGLLGALLDGSVDVALEPVTDTTPRHEMEFIFPIAETMSNIYIRQQETSTVRDIFLAPFSGRLVACVVAVAIAAALAVVVISKLAPGAKEHHMGYTEALLWSTGILCQQGGTWTPQSPAASVLLLACLLFGVVTYNAYAAFITSVLSVRVASVDTVTAVLREPNLQIGYIKNGADQMYLMSTKDVKLNAFYIRGYSNAENLVSSAEEGLARAASQDYAFFAGQRAARHALRSLSQARGRCAVREVPVHSTRAHLAFPLPRHSPYARPTLISLLQLRASGSLARLEASLVPEMPHCAPPAGFASARATDVRSALLLLATGYIAALLLGLGEYCWKNRSEIHVYIFQYYLRLVNVVRQI